MEELYPETIQNGGNIFRNYVEGMQDIQKLYRMEVKYPGTMQNGGMISRDYAEWR